MTYNVHRCVGADRRANPGRIAAVIAAFNPDIVALQELDVGRLRTGGTDQAHTIARLLGMDFHFHPSLTVGDELYGDAILTALPTGVRRTEGLPGPVGVEPRGALWVTVEAQPTPLQVINTHLGLWPSERRAQVETLLGPTWLGHPECRDPVVLLGDFNAGRWSSTYRLLTAQLRDAQHALKQHLQPTFHSRLPVLSIDHIFCSSSVKVVSVNVVRSPLARLASDHLPLLMDFHVGGELVE